MTALLGSSRIQPFFIPKHLTSLGVLQQPCPSDDDLNLLDFLPFSPATGLWLRLPVFVLSILPNHKLKLGDLLMVDLGLSLGVESVLGLGSAMQFKFMFVWGWRKGREERYGEGRRII